MPIVVNLDVMLAKRKMRLKTLSERVELTEQNLSMIKTGKARVCALKHWPKFVMFWTASPAIFSSLCRQKRSTHRRFHTDVMDKRP